MLQIIKTPDNIAEQIKTAKLRLLQMHYESGVGHIGGNLSCLDSLMVLHHQVMRPEDSFVLSKGHAAGALYTTLWSTGVLSDEDLKSFHRDGTKLSGHPSPNHLPEIPFATGSLGHGLSLAAGIALGNRLQNKNGRVFCLMSDGEWQEGSNWEALIFIQHQNLPITIIVDQNGLQGFGSTKSVAGQDSLYGRFVSCGLRAQEIDGHSHEALRSELIRKESRPLAVVANTIKGCGVVFMENRMEWHYKSMNQAEYEQAIDDVMYKRIVPAPLPIQRVA